MKKYIKYVSVLILFIAVLFMIISPYKIVIVSGNSMFPTIKDKEILIFKKVEFNINKNDLVVFDAPTSWTNTNTNTEFIKRIIALPKDEVYVTEDTLYVNNVEIVKLDEKLNIPENITYIVPDNEYFVMGDNVGHSNDSLYALTNQKQPVSINKNEINYVKEFTNDK